MMRFSFSAAVTGIACVLGLARSVEAQLLYPSADANVEEHTPTSDDTTQARIQVRSRDVAGTGRQNVGYIQFDLSGILSPLTDVRFEVTMQSTRASAAGVNQVYGLNDVAGNTAQNWTSLTYNTTGAELPGDGDSTTQDLGSIGTTGAENLWNIGDLPAIAGVAEEIIAINHLSNPELLSFLNSRIGNLATLLLVQDNAADIDLLFNSVEDPENLRPKLFIPEPSGGVLLGLGFLALAARRRRTA
jgi:hypothetical protein